MRCPLCQQDNPGGARFCNGCGARLELACPSCNHVNPSGSRFCNGCGAKLSEQVATEVEPRFASPETYTPKHLAEKILTSKAALEGERKQVTVLFADLKGSMELLADRDPEEARQILDPVLELMMEAVHRFEGTVNQVMGDGIMALFGAPIAHEDHAVRACYAALRMHDFIRSYAEEALRSSGVRIQIRVGLNSGDVVVRAISSDLLMDYTAVGQTTHLAARMEQLAKPGTTLLAPATLDLAEGYVTVTALGSVPIKGIVTPLDVYELTGAGAARSRLQATAARGLTKFVGRTAELLHLTRALELAEAHGQVVTVMGEPGVGKSRLVWELTHSHRTQGWLILEAGSIAHGRATPYLTIIDLLKSYCCIEPADDRRRIREKLAGKILALDPTLLESLPALLALFDVPTGDAVWESLEAPLRRHRTLEAVRHLLLRGAQVQPLLVVVEDLHWIDTESQAILDALVESLATSRILLLTSYRPEYHHVWGQKTYCSQIRLTPLSSESADELLDALLGSHAELDALRRRLVEQTEGNPFFLEESVRALVEDGALAGERGAYRLTRTIGTAKVPATVQTVLAARIDRLAPPHKRVLQAASVIGKDVPLALLEALGVESADVVRGALSELQRTEFLYQTRFFPEAEYTFKHVLTQEVAYRSLLHERRRALHGQVLTAIERLHVGRLDEHLERLALHAVRSEAWDKAAAYGAAAGASAQGRWALRGALASFEQAIAAVGHLPRTPDNLRRAVELRIDARACLLQLGDLAPMLEHLRAAEAAADALGDDIQRAVVTGHLAHAHWLMGQHERSIELSERELDLIRGGSELGLEALAHFQMGEARLGRGEFEQAAQLLDRALELRRKDPLQPRNLVGPLEVTARRWRSQALVELGRFQEAIALAREAVEIARAWNNPYALANAISALGLAVRRQGDFTAAIPILEEGFRLSRTLGFQSFVNALGMILGEALAEIGRTDDAQALLEKDLAFYTGSFFVFRPLVLLLVGRTHDARVQADKALARHRERGERGAEAWVLWMLGEIGLRESLGDMHDTAGRFTQARALAEQLGMRPLVAHCHRGLGKLCWRTGQTEQAREHLNTAKAMYREMEMTYWLEQAEAEWRGLREAT
jgi:class 3 adenylate cyclase/tetratricopeptide (TPR) repeat protein